VKFSFVIPTLHDENYFLFSIISSLLPLLTSPSCFCAANQFFFFPPISCCFCFRIQGTTHHVSTTNARPGAFLSPTSHPGHCIQLLASFPSPRLDSSAADRPTPQKRDFPPVPLSLLYGIVPMLFFLSVSLLFLS